MSVRIKGIDPPRDCRDCPYMNYVIRTGRTECSITHTTLAWDYRVIGYEGVASDCPIEAVED